MRKRLITAVVLAFSLTPIAFINSSHAATAKIAVIYDLGGRGDGGINDDAGLGVDKARKKFNLGPLALREIATNGTDIDRLLKIRFLAKNGYNPIILVGYGFQTSLNQAMTEFPDLEFGIIDSSNIGQLNVEAMVFNEAQTSYLAGVLAASASKTKKIGFIPDFYRTNLRDLTTAFRAGAASVNKKILVIPQMVGSQAGSDAAAMIKRGVDVIYSTFNSDSEVINEVVKLNSTKKPLRYIGVLPDQFYLKNENTRKVLIGASRKRVDTAVYDLIDYGLQNRSYIDVLDASRGVFGHEYDLKDGGVEFLVPSLGKAFIPAVLKAQAEIKAGKVKF